MTGEHAWRVPAPRLRPFASSYVGYRQEGGAPELHRGLPSPAVQFIVTLDDPLVIEAHPDPRQPAGSYDGRASSDCAQHSPSAEVAKRASVAGLHRLVTHLSSISL